MTGAGRAPTHLTERSGIDVRRQRAQVAQVAVPTGVVEAVPHDELVGQVVTDVLHLDRAAQRLGFLGTCRQVFALPVSVSSKSPFFDR